MTGVVSVCVPAGAGVDVSVAEVATKKSTTTLPAVHVIETGTLEPLPTTDVSDLPFVFPTGVTWSTPEKPLTIIPKFADDE